MTREDDLERLFDEAREASSTERLPTYRDAIAGFGEEAIATLERGGSLHVADSRPIGAQGELCPRCRVRMDRA